MWYTNQHTHTHNTHIHIHTHMCRHHTHCFNSMAVTVVHAMCCLAVLSPLKHRVHLGSHLKLQHSQSNTNNTFPVPRSRLPCTAACAAFSSRYLRVRVQLLSGRREREREKAGVSAATFKQQHMRMREHTKCLLHTIAEGASSRGTWRVTRTGGLGEPCPRLRFMIIFLES